MTMGNRIRQAREAKQFTQKGLGFRVGLSAATIGKLERNETSPRVETVERLAVALDCTTAHLFYGPRGFWARVFGWYPQIPQPQQPGVISTKVDVPQETFSEVRTEDE